jgi:hypothetical protein
VVYEEETCMDLMTPTVAALSQSILLLADFSDIYSNKKLLKALTMFIEKRRHNCEKQFHRRHVNIGQ